MKKIFRQSLFALLVTICILAITGCGSKENQENQENQTEESTDANGQVEKDDTISIVTTIYPIYDWVSQITREVNNVEVILLADNGVDLHNFQPTADDIINIAECDMFIYVGGESDTWVDNVLGSDIVAESENNDRVVMKLIDILGDNAKAEEVVEGMEDVLKEVEHSEEHAEIDEHVWLSLKNATLFCDAIEEQLIILDNENAEYYTANNDYYKIDIGILDEMYTNVVSESEEDTIIVCDRFPFRYLVDEYGLKYYAMFSGCSAETEASFETVVFLANKVNELGIKTVLTTESPKPNMAETVIISTGNNDIDILKMDSMQSITAKDIDDNISYLGIMEENLNVLKIALGYFNN